MSLTVTAGLLPVALDHRLRPHRSLVRILPAGPAGSALPQEVPTLVERDLDLAPSGFLVFGQPLSHVAGLEAVFLLDELPDSPKDLFVFHSWTSFTQLRNVLHSSPADGLRDVADRLGPR